MGKITADEFAGSGLPLDAQLQYHLSVNHYPPVHSIFVQVAKAAIELCNTGESDAVLTMPNGIDKSAAGIVQGLHLESWLDDNDDY